MIKAFHLKFGLENKYNVLKFNIITLESKDNRRIRDIFPDGVEIKAIQFNNPPYIFGKKVEVHISYTEKYIQHWIFDIGLLNSIKYIIKKSESLHQRKVKKLTIGKKKITRNDERCLSEIGIKGNFSCLIEFEKINNK